MPNKNYVVFLRGGADFRVKAQRYRFKEDLLVFEDEDGAVLDEELFIRQEAVQAIVPEPLGQRYTPKGFRPPGA